MKIMVAVPSMDMVPVRFCQSLSMLQKVGECAIGFQVGSLVYEARENLAHAAIQAEADYVLWLDSDMVFQPDVLQRLLSDIESGKGDIVSGLYFRRVSPYTPVLYTELEIDKEKGSTWKELESIPDDVFECGGVGFGCVLMPTDALVSVLSKFGCMFTPLHGNGEDISFCWRARQCGYKIVCDPKIELGHCGHYVITKEFYNVFQTAQGR